MRIDCESLRDLAGGAAFLGSGGGGDPYYGRLLGEAELTRHGPVELISLDELSGEAVVAPCGWIGAPTVSVEKLPNGSEVIAGLRKLEAVLGKKVDAILPIEIGGGNGLAPVVAAAKLKLPIVDADGMGRAFPESQMAIFNILGVSSCPAVITAADGSTVVIEGCGNLAHERIARAISVAMGGIAHMVEYPLTGREARRTAIRGSVSAAIAIGAAIREAHAAATDPFDALFDALRATSTYAHAGMLFDGKIVDLERETKEGFSVGRVTIESLGGAEVMQIMFKNENLVAERDGKVVALVPDIITIMDRESADSITTERLKYGQRVKVVGAAAPPLLREAKALSFVGPKAFGLAHAYQPVEALNGWSAS
jgi:DUF917 family protein